MFEIRKSNITKRVMRFKVFKTSTLFSLITLFLLLFSGIVQAELAPDFTLTDIDGNTFSLSDFRGKIVILEFFSIWCGRCINEIPHLKDVHNEFEEDELVIISICRSGTHTQLINFRNDYQIPWIIANDTANVFQLYNNPGYPTIYLIDHEGDIVYHQSNVVVEASTLITKVNELLIARADANGDGCINVWDLGLLSDAWLTVYGQPAFDEDCDFNDDDAINVWDLGIMSDYWLWGT